jgi:hypothetical protein
MRLNKNEWEVKEVGMDVAMNLVKKYHYARSATKTGVYRHGLFKKGFDKCLGVAWWLPPTKAAAKATWEGDFRKVLSLTRLVIHPQVPSNACSFLLGRSIRMIDSKKWKCLVTYADTYQNHTGIIYKASNWQYLGLTKPSPVWVDSNGKMMGKKRGAKNLTSSQMERNGFKKIGDFPKHKFRYIL